MAAYDFPDSPTSGQVYDKWTWNGYVWALTPPDGGSGFTFVRDTVPTAAKEGDTWFDTSDAASGGTSWLAVSEIPGSAGPLNWVQFAPGQGGGGGAGGPRGIVALGATTGVSSLAVAAGSETVVSNTITFTPLLGRMYRIRCNIRATAVSPANNGYLRCYSSNAAVPSAHENWVYLGGAYQHLSFEYPFFGNGVSSTFQMRFYTASAGSLWTDQPTSYFYIEDITYEAGSGSGSPGPVLPFTRRAIAAGVVIPTPNTDTNVAFGTLIAQNGAELIDAAGVFTAPTLGVYSLTTWVSFGAGTLGVQVSIRRSPQTGSAYVLANTNGESHANGYGSAGCSTTEWFNAGEKATVSVTVEGSGFNWNYSAGYAPVFSAVQVR